MTTTNILIDADGIVFAAASAVEKVIAWDDDIYTLHAELDEAKAIVMSKIHDIEEAVEGDTKPILCFSCPTRKYFRHSIYPSYKAHRGGSTRPPLLRRDLTEWAKTVYESWTRPGLEADDVLGILATSKKIIPGRKVIFSPDKDLLQIPGLKLDKGQIGEVSEETGWYQLWYQVLVGDSTDGYPGCPGVGPVKADKILMSVSPEEYPSACFNAYQKAGVQDTFETMVNVARILTASTYNFKTKEPILWQMQSTQS